jgi:hypothetical protein
LNWQTWLWRLGRVAILVFVIGWSTLIVAALARGMPPATLWDLLVAGQIARNAWKAIFTLVSTGVAVWQGLIVLAMFRDGFPHLINIRTLPHLMAAVGCLTVTMISGASFGSANSIFGAEAAAWAQAGGSIEALLIAVYVGQMALDVEERRRRRAKSDQIAMITDAIDMAVNNFDAVRGAVRRQHAADLKDAAAEVADARQKPFEDLAAISLASWPSAILYSRVLALHHAHRDFRRYLGSVHSTIEADRSQWAAGLLLDGKYATALRDYQQSIAGVTLD